MTRTLMLTDNDFRCLAEIGLVGSLDTALIHARHFVNDRSGRYCHRRLRQYAAEGLTQRVKISVAYGDRIGRHPTIHRLTETGADVVAEHTGQRPPRVARSATPNLKTLQHRLDIARFVLALNDACELLQLPVPTWHLEYDARPGVKPQEHLTLAQRFLLCHQYPQPDGSRLTVWPDAATMLELPGKSGTSHRVGLACEIDRSTERHAQILGKLLGYRHWLEQRSYRDIYPHENLLLRIFLIVPSEPRLANLSKLLLDLTKDHPALVSIIRLAILSDLTSDTILTHPHWRTPTGDRRPIYQPLS